MNAHRPVEDATGGRKLPLANGRRGGLGLSFQDLNSSVKGTDMAVLRHCPAFQAAWRNLGTLARHAVFGPYLKAARRPSLAEHTGLNPATLPAGSPSTRYRADRLSTRGTTARKSCWKLSCALRKYSNMQKCKNGWTKRRVDGILVSSNRLFVPPFLHQIPKQKNQATLDSAPKISGSPTLLTSTVVRAMLGIPLDDLCLNLPSTWPPGAMVRLL